MPTPSRAYSLGMEGIRAMRDNSKARPPLVLIIEDDDAVRDSLVAVLEAFGFRTMSVSNGAEGLRAVKAAAPSAIITDLQMPEMGGLDLMAVLRKAATRIPIIAMSGSSPSEIDAARSIGAAAAFHKPLPVLEMIDTVCNLTAHAA